MAGYSWEDCPAVDGLYGCCRLSRARVRRAVPPCTGVRQAALREELTFWVGFDVLLGSLPIPKGPGERLVKRSRRGAAFAHGGAPAHKLVERVAPSAPTSLLRVTDTSRTVVIYNNETLNAASLDRARHNKCFTHLCFVATAIRRPRSARINTSSSASFTQ